MKTYFEIYVLSGGPLMVALIFCSVMLLAIVVQSIIRLRRERVIPGFLTDKAGEVSNLSDRMKYVQEMKDHTSPLARALKMTLKDLDIRGEHRPHRRQLEPVVTESVAHVADDLYEETGLLSTLYTVAPLLGLLGTILGMMKAFREFAAEQEKNLTALSEGIQEALVTTLWGLAIAIAAYVAAHFFQSKIRRYERNHLPREVFQIIASLYGNQAAQAAPAASAAPSRTAAAGQTARPAASQPSAQVVQPAPPPSEAT